MDMFRIRRRQFVQGASTAALFMTATGSRAQGTKQQEEEVEATEDLIEDTVVFPAWKEALHKMFGRDGFEDAVKRVGAIEQDLGLSDLASFTAPLPPEKQRDERSEAPAERQSKRHELRNAPA